MAAEGFFNHFLDYQTGDPLRKAQYLERKAEDFIEKGSIESAKLLLNKALENYNEALKITGFHPNARSAVECQISQCSRLLKFELPARERDIQYQASQEKAKESPTKNGEQQMESFVHCPAFSQSAYSDQSLLLLTASLVQMKDEDLNNPPRLQMKPCSSCQAIIDEYQKLLDSVNQENHHLSSTHQADLEIIAQLEIENAKLRSQLAVNTNSEYSMPMSNEVYSTSSSGMNPLPALSTVPELDST